MILTAKFSFFLNFFIFFSDWKIGGGLNKGEYGNRQHWCHLLFSHERGKKCIISFLPRWRTSSKRWASSNSSRMRSRWSASDLRWTSLTWTKDCKTQETSLRRDLGIVCFGNFESITWALMDWLNAGKDDRETGGHEGEWVFLTSSTDAESGREGDAWSERGTKMDASNSWFPNDSKHDLVRSACWLRKVANAGERKEGSGLEKGRSNF